MRSLQKNWKKMGKKIKIKLVFHNSTNQAVNISSRIFSLFTQRVCFFNLQKNGSFCLSILKINVKFTQHKVSHLKVNRSGDLVAKHFHYRKRRPGTHETVTPHSNHSHPLATANLFSASLDLPILATSYKQNHTICDLLSLSSFTEHTFSEVQHITACISTSFLIG